VQQLNHFVKVLAFYAVPELVIILPDVKATNDIIKKPVDFIMIDDFIMAVKNVPDH